MDNSESTNRQLTVNAAFLKDIKDDNRELKLLMDQISPLVDPLPTALNHWSELVPLLADLRDQLAMHFALEEAYGYFDDALVTAPQLNVTAQCLRGQHAELFAHIVKLADQAAETPVDAETRIAKLLKQFGQFRDAFQEHEEAELNLILTAMGDDLGVGD